MERRGIVLYGKPGCHLCDDAEAIVRRVADELGLPWVKRDITEAPDLFARYKHRIPVIQIDGRGELDWPTTATRVRNAALTASH